MTLRRRDVALLATGVLAPVAIVVLGVGARREADALPTAISSALYMALAAYVIVRRPEHRAAQRMLIWAVVLAVGSAAGAVYSVWTQYLGTPPWAWAAVIVLQLLLWLGSVAACALFLVFPDGRYRTRWDRRTIHVTLVLPLLLVVGELVAAPELSIGDLVWNQSPDTATNPFALRGLTGLGTLAGGLLGAGVPLVVLVGAALLLVRYLTSSAADRRQIAWPLAALAATGILEFGLGLVHLLLPPWPQWLSIIVYAPVLSLLPAGLLIGMLKYQLLDLRLVIRRTVLYAVLWVLTTVAYVVVAGVAGVVAGSRLPLAMAVATTVLVALLIAPIRHRLERWADRAVFGAPVAHDELLGDVGRRLAAGPGPDDAAAALADAARRGLRASWVVVRLGDDEVRDPVDVADADPALLVAIDLAEATVGEIRCGQREDRPYTPSDRLVLEALGRQAAWSVRTASLSTELQDKVRELEASRRRLVQAEETSRRRIERDLHDGAQAELVGLLATLALTANQLRRDPSLAATTLREARDHARQTLERLQELVRGIHPTILTDRGLVRAITEQAGHMPVPTTVQVLGGITDPRWSSDVEAGMYFAVTESLANVAKHSGANTAWVTIHPRADELQVEVGDDGHGFDTTTAAGSGIVGLTDRLAALGGTLDVTSSGAGTTVVLTVPGTPIRAALSESAASLGLAAS